MISDSIDKRISSIRRLRAYWQMNARTLDSDLGTMLLYVSFVFIFHNIWLKLMPGGTATGFEATQLTWYLALTEIIALGVYMLGFEIEKDMRSGSFLMKLLRPAGVIREYLLKGSLATGFLVMKLTVVGLSFTTLLTGRLPISPLQGLQSLVLLAGALILALQFHLMIGFAGTWVANVRPYYYVWQKMMFVFGGMLIPLDLYPVAMGELSRWTPFSAILYIPASTALGFGPTFLVAVAVQWFWIAVIYTFTAWMLRSAMEFQMREGALS